MCWQHHRPRPSFRLEANGGNGCFVETIDAHHKWTADDHGPSAGGTYKGGTSKKITETYSDTAGEVIFKGTWSSTESEYSGPLTGPGTSEGQTAQLIEGVVMNFEGFEC